MKNAIIGALSGYAFTEAPIWEIRENMFIIGIFFAVLVWIFVDWFDKKYEGWRIENEDRIEKFRNSRLQRRKSKKV